MLSKNGHKQYKCERYIKLQFLPYQIEIVLPQKLLNKN